MRSTLNVQVNFVEMVTEVSVMSFFNGNVVGVVGEGLPDLKTADLFLDFVGGGAALVLVLK